MKLHLGTFHLKNLTFQQINQFSRPWQLAIERALADEEHMDVWRSLMSILLMGVNRVQTHCMTISLLATYAY
jgi:hypothetical protein